jgi:hypothetical protein
LRHGAPSSKSAVSALKESKTVGIKPDKWIRRLAKEHQMIEPFEPGMIRENANGKAISFGT